LSLQDQWWLSGIFRDVWLHSFPATRFEDFHVQTILEDDYDDAWLQVNVTLNQPGVSTEVKLLDAEGKVIIDVVDTPSEAAFQCRYFMESPNKWTAETPYLYTLLLSAGGVHVSQKVGFRRAELIDGVFCVNGNPVKFRGVNRHEHHP
jgi:beta-galactosidase